MGSHRVGHDWRDLAAAAEPLEGNKKMQFLLNALQAPSAKKEDKNLKKKYEKDITTAKIDRIKKHYTNKLNYLEETVNF